MWRDPTRDVAAVLWLCAVTAGCGFSASVPSTAVVSCQAGTTCPAGTTCVASISRCVANTALDGPAEQVLDTQLQPTRGSLQATFTLSFVVTQPLFAAPAVTAEIFDPATGAPLVFDFTCATCSPSATCSCSLTLPSAPPPPDGLYSVQVQATDRGGKEIGPVPAGAFTLDTAAPALTGGVSRSWSAAPQVATPVSELGPVSQAELCFQVDEALGATPALSSDPAGLGFTEEAGYPTSDQRYCFTVGFDGGVPSGPATVEAQLVDLVGNAATVSLLGADGGLVIAAGPPPPPDVADDDGLYLHRAPWGDPPQFGIPVVQLRSGASAIPQVGYLRVYADAAGTQVLGQVAVQPGPLTAPLALASADVTNIWAELVDLAGNRSAGGPQHVVLGEWVATLGNKVVGDTTSNPHQCFGRPADLGTLTEADDSVVELGASSGPTNPSAPPVHGGAAWRQRWPNSATTFSDAEDASFASNTAQQILFIAFGGENEDQLWSWDGRDLTPLTIGLSGGPDTRNGAAAAYDSINGQTIVFGGWDDLTSLALCDVWLWNGTSWAPGPTCEFPPFPDGGGDPPGRGDAAVVYDPIRRQLVVLGGEDSNFNAILDAWTLAGQVWTPLDLGANPPPLEYPVATFYPTTANDGVLVLVGVDLADDGGPPELWTGTWQDGGYAWAQLNPNLCATTAECVEPQFAPHPGGLDFVADDWFTLTGLDGGIELVSAISQDPLLQEAFVNSAWIPPGRSPRVMQLIADGEEIECPMQGPCKILHQNLGPVPTARSQGTMAFGPDGQALLYGGDDVFSGNAVTAGGWWTGNDWLPVPNGPAARDTAGIAYDAEQARFVLAGGGTDDNAGEFGDVWAYSFDGGWSELWARAFGDAGVDSHQLVSVTGQGLLLFGDTQPVYRVADEARVATAVGPTPPFSGCGAFDSARNTAVLDDDDDFGALAEWVPGAATWSVVLGQGAPGSAPGTLYDAAAKRTLFLFGVPPAPQVASWDGSTLATVVTTGPYGSTPAARYRVTAASDPSTGTDLFFAGDNVNVGFQETWELSLARSQPAVVCRFTVGAAELPAGTVLTQLALNAVAGGTSGAQLALWSGGAFAPVAQCSAADGGCSASTPAALDYQGNPPLGLVDDLNDIGVEVRPLSPNGAGTAQIEVPSLAATLSYRLP